jgi:hypothetical protein
MIKDEGVERLERQPQLAHDRVPEALAAVRLLPNRVIGPPLPELLALHGEFHDQGGSR